MFGSTRSYGPVDGSIKSTPRRSLFSDTWFLEIGALCLSAATLVGQIILLNSYNEKPLFTWHGFTLNTWVSILSTVSKTTLLFTVGSCLGQWKFIDFSHNARNGRPLFGYDVLDGASRGPYGALYWLCYSRFQSVANIGALIMILALALDPFAQQIVGLGELGVADSNNVATIPQILRYSRASTQSTSETVDTQLPDGTNARNMETDPDDSVSASLLFSLSQSTKVVEKSFSAPICPGSTCDWDRYRSLAVCGRCTDISNLITVTEEGPRDDPYIAMTFASASAMIPNHTEAHLPNGQFIASTSTTLSGIDTFKRNDSLAFKDVDSYLWSTIILQNTTDGTLKAQECAILICVNEYQSMWVNGSLSEEISEYTIAKVPDSWQPDPNREIKNGYDYKSDPNQDSLTQSFDYGRYDFQLRGKGNETFNITQKALNTLGHVFSDTFGGALNNNTGVASYCGANSRPCGGGKGVTSIYGADYASFNKTIKAMALGVSNSMRAFADNDTTVQGRVNIQVYQIRWEWMSLPAALAVASAIFLVWTILRTRSHGVPLWKLSAIPSVLYGSEWARDETRPRMLGDMEKNSRRLPCRVGWPEGGAVFSDNRTSVIELKPKTSDMSSFRSGSLGPSNSNVNIGAERDGRAPSNDSFMYHDIGPIHYDRHEYGDLGRSML